ncbi:MAG TPA: hypothetical protein VGQ18_01885 [Gemmatimonadales bacterium]|jgi:hypothetical protein|nr:hypothetical protein [Gemmatimonadales bacterium]
MKVLAYSIYFGSAAVLLSLSLLGSFLGDLAEDLVAPFVVLGLLAGGLLVLAYTAMRPSWAKARELLIAVCVTAGAIRLAPTIRTAGVTLFWATREDRATTFVAEILSYGRVREMDDGLRYFNRLNGERGDGLPVQAVLVRDAIDPGVFERFQRRLRELKLVHVEVREDCIAFVQDGFLDNVEGFFWVRPGHRPPPLYSEFVYESELVGLRPLGNGWYYFATT